MERIAPERVIPALGPTQSSRTVGAARRRSRILALYQGGEGLVPSAIARKEHISFYTVRAHLEDAGFCIPKYLLWDTKGTGAFPASDPACPHCGS